jgi:hypothetical protein
MSNNIELMLLWVPLYPGALEETDDLIEKVTSANDAILEFSEGIITLDDTFQIIEHYGADVDEYREIIDNNLRVFGV